MHGDFCYGFFKNLGDNLLATFPFICSWCHRDSYRHFSRVRPQCDVYSFPSFDKNTYFTIDTRAVCLKITEAINRVRFFNPFYSFLERIKNLLYSLEDKRFIRTELLVSLRVYRLNISGKLKDCLSSVMTKEFFHRQSPCD